MGTHTQIHQRLSRDEESPLGQDADEWAARMRAPRVLLVEDDIEMRRFLASALRREGYEVIELADGEEFLNFAAGPLLEGRGDAPPADVVVSDIRMPQFGGFDILNQVRGLNWHASMPVILITAFGDETTHATARRLGARAVLDKPFDVGDLRALVRDSLGTSA